MGQTEDCKELNEREYYRQIKQIPILTHDQKLELFEAYKKGDQEARKQLIQADFRWAYTVAIRYFDTFGMDPMDIIQWANIGLMKAIEKYDPTRNASFTHFESYYIRNAIRKGIVGTARLLHIPFHKADLQACLLEEQDDYYKKTGTHLNSQELSQRLGVEQVDVDLLLLHMSPPVWLEGISPAANHNRSFDYDPSTIQWEDLIVDSNVQIENEVMRNCLEDTLLSRLVTVLTPKEYDVISRYYGLQEYDAATLSDIAPVYGVSVERVRQIVEKAKYKLSRSHQIAPFKEYIKEGNCETAEQVSTMTTRYSFQKCKKREKKK